MLFADDIDLIDIIRKQKKSSKISCMKIEYMICNSVTKTKEISNLTTIENVRVPYKNILLFRIYNTNEWCN